MKIAYVAGSYRADTVNGIHDNIQRARAVAVKLWRIGYAVICPHLNSAFMDGAVGDRSFIMGDIEIMLKAADCVVVMPGSDNSFGVRVELMNANRVGIRVFHYPADIRAIKDFVEDE